MKHLVFTPHPALRPYIQHYAYTDQGSEGSWAPSHLAATGSSALSFAYRTDRVTLQEKDKSITHYEPLAFVGQATKFKSIHLHNRVQAFFVIFKPCGAFRLLGMRQEEMVNQCINLSDILGSSVRLITDELSVQNDISSLHNVLENFFLRPLLKNKMNEEGTRLSCAMEQIKNHSHVNNNLITTVCREYGYSIKGLERRMKEFAGIGPKLFQRIARFNATLAHINKSNYQCNWAQTAYQFGYCDQSHFIKEFKLFYGQTPAMSNPNDQYVTKTVFQDWET